MGKYNTKFILVIVTFLLSVGCTLKKDFLNQSLKSVSDVSLESLGENHKVGAGQVLISGYCPYGSAIQLTYGSGFDASSPTTATCSSCSSSENPDCGNFWNNAGKYSVIGILNGSSGSREVTITAKDSENKTLSTLKRNFTYQPISQEAFAKPALSNGRLHFGKSVDIDADTMVVGSNFDPNMSSAINAGTDYTVGQVSGGAGGVHVFRKVSGVWTQEAYLKGPYVITQEYFGYAVAISGDTIAVGAYADDRAIGGVYNAGSTPATEAGAASAGSVYVFKRTGTTWALESYLRAPYPTASDLFGMSVDISGDTIVVGARNDDSALTGAVSAGSMTDDNTLTNSGAAYVFKRTSTTWALEALLKAPNPDADDQFGQSVSIDGDVIAVGAHQEDSNDTGVSMGTTASANNSMAGTGAVYIYRRSSSVWTHEAFVKGHSINNSDFFGYSVALSGNTLVVGAYGEDSNVTGAVNGTSGSTNNGVSASGAAYVFFYDTFSSTWAQQSYLKGSNTSNTDNFGYNVAIDGDTIAVGAWKEDSNVTGAVNGTSGSTDNSVTDTGAVYVFKRTGVNWAQESYLKAAANGVDYNFGESIAVDGDNIVVGQANDRSMATGITMGTTADTGTSASYVGAAYVFTRSGSNWTQEANFKPHVQSSYNTFGSNSIDLDGDTLVVGNIMDMNSSTSITNSSSVATPTGSFVLEVGSAYVFRRVSGTWVQEAYLKAPNAGSGDNFGVSVAISGDTIVVGAASESNSTTGVQNGSIVTDNSSAAGAGAAYVFTRSGSTWSFQSYLKSSVVVAGDSCGRQVDVDGDTIAVACDLEDSSIGGVVNSSSAGAVDSSTTNSGAVYVYKRTGTTWAQEAYIKPAVVNTSLRFGYTNVKLSGDVLAVSTEIDLNSGEGIQSGTNGGSSTTSGSSNGSAWVFRRTGSNWAQEAFIKPPVFYTGGRFGRLSIKGDDLAISSVYDKTSVLGVQNTSNPSIDNSGLSSGAVYIYKYASGQWSLKSFLKPPNAQNLQMFRSVSQIDNDRIIIGAGRDNSTGTSIVHGARIDSTVTSGSSYSGSFYVYRRLNDQWYLADYIKAPNSSSYSQFGYFVELSGQNVVVGAPTEHTDGNSVINAAPSSSGRIYYSGAVYMYRLDN